MAKAVEMLISDMSNRALWVARARRRAAKGREGQKIKLLVTDFVEVVKDEDGQANR